MSLPEDIIGADVFDSRDVIEAITLLESQPAISEQDAEDLAILKQLEIDGKFVTADWEDGASFIRDDYFEEYAEQLAEEIGAIDREAGWPLGHIDWTAAANALKQDYTPLLIGADEYWTRVCHRKGRRGMRKAEWANTDSRIEIEVDGEETTITVVYDRDTYLTDVASITMSTNDFSRLLQDARTAIVEDAHAR